jgi:hypothetical protein
MAHWQSNDLLVFWHFIGNMDDKRLPLVASTGNLDNAPTMVTRAALTLWYFLLVIECILLPSKCHVKSLSL